MIAVLSGLQSCKPDKAASRDDHQFFSLKKFISADSARMTKANPLVTKTVVHNGQSQTKKLHIGNWGSELGLFSESDINRPAWKSEYTVEHSDSLTLYTATNPDLRTRRIILKQVNGKVIYLNIYNHEKNALSETKEALTYFPDSAYVITKWQHVKLLGTNTYKITGMLK